MRENAKLALQARTQRQKQHMVQCQQDSSWCSIAQSHVLRMQRRRARDGLNSSSHSYTNTLNEFPFDEVEASAQWLAATERGPRTPCLDQGRLTTPQQGDTVSTQHEGVCLGDARNCGEGHTARIINTPALYQEDDRSRLVLSESNLRLSCQLEASEAFSAMLMLFSSSLAVMAVRCSVERDERLLNAATELRALRLYNSRWLPETTLEKR